MKITTSEDVFRDIASTGFPIRRGISLIIRDQTNFFKFVGFLDHLTLMGYTVSSSISKEFIAFMKYLDLFYDLGIDEILEWNKTTGRFEFSSSLNESGKYC